MSLRTQGCHGGCNPREAQVSGIRGSFFIPHGLVCSESFGHQEAIGCDTQRRMMVESAPAPAFVVTKAELLFQVLVIALNTPTHFGHEHQLFYQRIGWCCGQEVFGWLRFAPGHSTSNHSSSRKVLRQ